MTAAPDSAKSFARTYKGLKVLELASVIAGPYATMILADQGAEVVKVENPAGGDDARSMPPFAAGHSTLFEAMNRNKRSVALDLKDPAGREVALRLAAESDVVVQSFRPGVAERLGLGFEDLAELNPGLVYCSISAFGGRASGDGLPGYDPLIQAFVGLMSMTGDPDAPPSRVAASLIDLSTGMWAAMGVMAALARRAGGTGPQLVEATLLDSGYMLLCHQIVSMLATGEVPRRLGSASTIAVPYEAFSTRDGWVMVTAGNDPMFARLCEAVESPALAGPGSRYATNEDRVERRLELRDELQASFARRTTDEWVERLEAARVPVSPIRDLGEAVADPIVAERSILVEDENGRLPLLRLPIDDARPPRFAPAPGLGEQTAEILQAAGVDEEAIGAILAKLPAPSEAI